MKISKQIFRRDFIKLSGIGAIFGLLGLSEMGCSSGEEKNSKPNIILVVADDMGFSDAGCYGGEIDTPHLDRLARNGLRFTQFYNCARCCPTRASLMTGLYPHQVGLARNGQNLSQDCVTIPEVLKTAGYHTAMVGKWHLSQTTPLENRVLHQKWLDHQYDPGVPFSPLETYPVNRGFDKHYGIVWGVINYFDPFSLVEGTQAIKEVPEDYYFTDALTDKAIEYIKELSESPKPFFLYIAHCAPHWPLHALPGDIEKYKDRYKAGWRNLRKERFDRQIEMKLFDKASTFLPDIQDNGLEWEDLSYAEKQFQSEKMAVHAAMVDRMDQSIGKILTILASKGILENTLILFLSDNGASPEIPLRPGFDRSSKTRSGKHIQYTGLFQPGTERTYTGIGPAWSSASNTPFRFWKKESFEGGCHTPFIAHWPNGITTESGRLTSQVGHVMDVMPTLLELAGIPYPKSFAGKRLPKLEGKSLLPIFKGKESAIHDLLFFEHMGGKAIRIGDWKLVALNKGEWELYDFSKDRTEMTNLAAKYPEKVTEMREKWAAWSGRVHVPPPPV